MTTKRLADTPIPTRMAHLPMNTAGYRIPWFVATLDDGSRDFRIASPGRFAEAIRFSKCWVCGQPMGVYAAFAIGPMCAVNRVTAEPGAHTECAIYSAKVCPFLTRPDMRRRDSGLDELDIVDPGGVMLLRNPGVAVVWVTRTWTPYRAPGGVLIGLGDPLATHWFREGRPATYAEAKAAIDSGLPVLQDACRRDADPEESLAELDREYRAALALLPEDEEDPRP